MKNETRFRVVKEKNVIYFAGVLTDTPNLNVLDGLVKDGDIFDFTNLEFASWLGLQEIGHYILESRLKIEIQNVKFEIYDFLRTMNEFKHIKFQSAEIPVINIENGNLELHKFNLKELQSNCLGCDTEATLEQKYKLALPNSFICPSSQSRWNPKQNDVHSTGLPISTIIFWRHYAAFTATTVQMSLNLAKSAKLNIVEFTKEIRYLLVAGESAIKELGHTDQATVGLVDSLDKMMIDVDILYRKLEDKIQEAYSKLLFNMGVVFNTSFKTHSSAHDLSIAICNFFTSVENMQLLTKKAEECGHSIGTYLNTLRSTKILKMAIGSAINLSNEQLAKVRDIFAIMDLFSETSWPATRRLILNDLTKIDHLIGNCIVTLQGFDMMRQILEHRIQEAKKVIHQINTNGLESTFKEDFISRIVNTIGAYMVTEQEKSSYAYFMPSYQHEILKIERLKPGKIVNF